MLEPCRAESVAAWIKSQSQGCWWKVNGISTRCLPLRRRLCSNEGLRLRVRDHRRSFRPGGKPHLPDRDGTGSPLPGNPSADCRGCQWWGAPWVGDRGLMFHLGQLRLVWIHWWPLTLAAKGCISSSSRLEKCWRRGQTAYIWIFNAYIKII